MSDVQPSFATNINWTASPPEHHGYAASHFPIPLLSHNNATASAPQRLHHAFDRGQSPDLATAGRQPRSRPGAWAP
jgi:hypothetical protein